MRAIPLIFLTACGPAPSEVIGDDDDTDLLTFSGDDDDDDSVGDTDPTGSTTLTGDFHGTEPPVVISAPEFDAINRDGGDRSKPDLLDHPTVMWFFPLAGTPG